MLVYNFRLLVDSQRVLVDFACVTPVVEAAGFFLSLRPCAIHPSAE